MYSYQEMELMTENATLKERCDQLEKRIKLYEDLIAILAKDKVTVPPMVNPNPVYPYPNPLYPHRPDVSLKLGCPKCGVGADGQPMGYVCNRTDCPTGVTC